MAAMSWMLVLMSALASLDLISIRMTTSPVMAEGAEVPKVLGSDGEPDRRVGTGVPCDSWRLGVEAHNVRGWKTVPASCELYVGNYMLGRHYHRDSKVVVDEAVAYAEGLKLAGNGKEVWIFDVDETSLSHLRFMAKHGFGAKPMNLTSVYEYLREAISPALPETHRLYKTLLSLGVKPVFLTGRTEDLRAATTENLRRQGYSVWEKLLLRPVGFNATAVVFKSGERQKLQHAGYVIVGNIGDQWSDILGSPEGDRTFKLPNPMYYAA